MVIGWQWPDGVWYFFESISCQNQGHLYRNSATPDGFRVGSEGTWIQ